LIGVLKKADMSIPIDSGQWAEIGTTIGGIFGAIAFFWKVIDFIIAQRGYINPKLECESNYYDNKYYIGVKTSVENTSRRPIYLANAYLLMVSPSSKNHDEILIWIGKQNDIAPILDAKQQLEFPNYKKLYELCVQPERNNQIEVKDKDTTAIFKIMPYYTSLHSRLGAFANLSSNIMAEVGDKEAVWSIYFGVIGKDWYRRWILKRRSDFRIVHEDVIVKKW